MIVLAILLVLVLAVAGYRTWSQLPASTTPATTTTTTVAGYARACVGVPYLQFASSATVEWTREPATK